MATLASTQASSVASTSKLPPAVAAAAVLAQPTSEMDKLGGREWWTSIGSPKYVVAPMVDQSELAWRVLSRVHGATLCYTPMFHAALFGSTAHPQYASSQFDTSPESIEGVAPYDRPLVVQFCANDKDQWLAAAEKVVGRCDAVDLNLGCPQGIAKRGRYGAFLMEEWDLIASMISHLHAKLALPVIAKIRVFPTLDRTLAYASHVFSAGAQLLTVHGRVREAKGRQAGLASWPKIAAVRQCLPSSVPLLANGGIPSSEEVEPCLDETGADGIMSAEGNLYNPMLFSPQNAAGGRQYRASLPEDMRTALDECDKELDGTWGQEKPAYAPATYLASQYLAIVRTLPSTQTGSSAMKAHLFKLFRPIWAVQRHLELRETLGKTGGGKTSLERAAGYQVVVDQMRQAIQADIAEGLLPKNSNRLLSHADVVAEYDGVIPYSHSQPYLRVASSEAVQDAEALVTDASSSTTPATTDKRPRSDDDVIAVPEAKKVKSDAPEAPAVPLVNNSALCQLGASHSPPCINTAAVKCSHNACIACCSRGLDAAESTCEFHAEKLRKEKEKGQLKKRLAKEKRQKQLEMKNAKQRRGGKGQENEAVHVSD